MNFETTLIDSNSPNTTTSNIDALKCSNSSTVDFIPKSNQTTTTTTTTTTTNTTNDEVKNVLNSSVSKTNTVPVIDPSRPFESSPLGLQSKTSTTDDILFRNTISHSHHCPHPQALRELSAVVNNIGLGNGLNVNNGMNNTIGLGNNIGGINSLDKNFKKESSEEFNLFNNRTFSNSNVSLSNSNNIWSPLQWNNYINPIKPKNIILIISPS